MLNSLEENKNIYHFSTRNSTGSWYPFSQQVRARFLTLSIPCIAHDDVIKWKHFPRCWPFVRGIHRSPVSSPKKGQWRRALVFFICPWTNVWINKRDVGDLWSIRAHHDVTVMRLWSGDASPIIHVFADVVCLNECMSLFICTPKSCFYSPMRTVSGICQWLGTLCRYFIFACWHFLLFYNRHTLNNWTSKQS